MNREDLQSLARQAAPLIHSETTVPQPSSSYQEGARMPDQAEHEKPENLVEESQELEREAARSLNDATDSHATLDGYYAMNNARPSKELEEEASKDRDERLKKGQAAP